MDTCDQCGKEIRPGTPFITYARHIERLDGGTITVEDAESLRTVHPGCDRPVLIAVGSRRPTRRLRLPRPGRRR